MARADQPGPVSVWEDGLSHDEIFRQYRLLHIRPRKTAPKPGRLKLLHVILRESSVESSWVAETPNGLFENAVNFLTGMSRTPFYSSFVLDGDAGRAFLASIGTVDLEVPLEGWQPTGTVWSFFGSAGDLGLVGKPEHVDQLRPGVITMHHQVAGSKLWRLRPNVAAPWDSPPKFPGRWEICCEEGDRLVIDTSAWYHATSIAPQEFSWSIALDFQDASATDIALSFQLKVTHQLCQRCFTPTAPPPGAPANTCGCDCCSQRRLQAWLFQSLRRSALITQRLLARRVCQPRPRLAICDQKIDETLQSSLLEA